MPRERAEAEESRLIGEPGEGEGGGLGEGEGSIVESAEANSVEAFESPPSELLSDRRSRREIIEFMPYKVKFSTHMCLRSANCSNPGS